MSDGPPQSVTIAVERLVDADPTKVWALVADPDLIDRWAGLETVGYMGTELPKPGQSVFVRRRRFKIGAKTRRIEIEDWEAGSTVKCLVETASSAVRFEIGILPEVTQDRIMTRVKLSQAVEGNHVITSGLGWLVRRSLGAKLDRIEKAVVG